MKDYTHCVEKRELCRMNTCLSQFAYEIIKETKTSVHTSSEFIEIIKQ